MSNSNFAKWHKSLGTALMVASVGRLVGGSRKNGGSRRMARREEEVM